MLRNIFDSIKTEEITLLKRQIIDEGKATQNGQIRSSTCVYVKLNLAENCIKTIYKRFLQKLKDDKLNNFIKKNSRVFLACMKKSANETFEIITTDITKTNATEETEYLNKTYCEPLLELTNEIINQWNNEAQIQKNIKQKEKIDGLKKFIISFITSLLVGIICVFLSAIISNKLNIHNTHKILTAGKIFWKKVETGYKIYHQKYN